MCMGLLSTGKLLQLRAFRFLHSTYEACECDCAGLWLRAGLSRGQRQGRPYQGLPCSPRACTPGPAAASSHTCAPHLQACGFELVFQEVEDKAGLTEGFAVLPEHVDLALLQAALQLLGHPMSAQQPRPASSGASSNRTAFISVPAGTNCFWDLVRLAQTSNFAFSMLGDSLHVHF